MTESRYVPALRFRSLTRLYDPVIRLTTRERNFKHRLLEQASIGPDDRVLDLACGTGTLAIAAKRRRPAADVVGLDGDPEILRLAQGKAEAASLEIAFDHGLSTELPYPDASFDAVLSTLFLHHLTREDKLRTVAEIARVLKPGGQLHVADWGAPADPVMRVLFFQVRLLDGFEQTRDNGAGALPSMFEDGGLVDAGETDRLRTLFGTLSLYRASAPGVRSGQALAGHKPR